MLRASVPLLRRHRLAAVVGVGIALSAGCGIAAADAGSPEPPRADASDGAAAPTPRAPRNRDRIARPPSAIPPRAAASSGRAANEVAPRRGIVGPPRPSAARVPVLPATDADATPAAVTAPAADPAPPAPADRQAGPIRKADVARSQVAKWPAPISARQVMTPATSPLTTATVAGLALTNVIQFGVLLTVSALSAAPPGPLTTTPTLRLNGFDLVPASPQEVTSLYGRWSYMPGAPGLIQGRQTFGVVDTETGERVGTFDALVARGNGVDFTELLVTSSAGTAAAPPVGSLISSLRLGPVGLSYSALPTPSGNTVSLKFLTPFGDIPVPFPFDNAKGIGDRTVDNRPMRLGNGYSIAPADPNGETLTAISGIMPGFMTVQGNQTFSVYGPDGSRTGDFEGDFTTTSDLFFYTQAVRVTASDSGNVGSGPGQVPPVGSVFNVIYFGSDDNFLLYSSLPGPGGADVSVIRVDRGKVTTSALTLIDATKPPAVTLSGAGGFTFVPVSALLPTGVNGLPPREVQTQGYQQFDVCDSAGARIGSVDADVFAQWDSFGVRSTALLVTRVGQGGADVPPPGSIFNFINGRRGFGTAHSVVPRPSGNLTSFKLLTPFGEIELPTTFTPAPRRATVLFYSPFDKG